MKWLNEYGTQLLQCKYHTYTKYLHYYYSLTSLNLRFYDRNYLRVYNNGKWIKTKLHIPLKVLLKQKQCR